MAIVPVNDDERPQLGSPVRDVFPNGGDKASAREECGSVREDRVVEVIIRFQAVLKDHPHDLGRQNIDRHLQELRVYAGQFSDDVQDVTG